MTTPSSSPCSCTTTSSDSGVLQPGNSRIVAPCFTRKTANALSSRNSVLTLLQFDLMSSGASGVFTSDKRWRTFGSAVSATAISGTALPLRTFNKCTCASEPMSFARQAAYSASRPIGKVSGVQASMRKSKVVNVSIGSIIPLEQLACQQTRQKSSFTLAPIFICVGRMLLDRVLPVSSK